jgi:predicted TPR repeat methyltransferase
MTPLSEVKEMNEVAVNANESLRDEIGQAAALADGFMSTDCHTKSSKKKSKAKKKLLESKEKGAEPQPDSLSLEAHSLRVIGHPVYSNQTSPPSIPVSKLYTQYPKGEESEYTLEG